MTQSEFLDAELLLENDRQATFAFDGREYSGEPLLDESLEEQLAQAELAPTIYGTRLFDAVFGGTTGDLHAGYREALLLARLREQRLRFRLRITNGAPAHLHGIHWEYLYDEKKGTAVSRSRDTIFSRYLNVPTPSRQATVEKPRLLIAIAAPDDLSEYEIPKIDSLRVRRKLRQALQPLRHQIDYEFLEGPVTPVALRERLVTDRYHLLHLYAHGVQGEPGDVADLILQADNGHASFVDATVFSEVIEGDRSLRAVILTACHSGHQSRTEPFRGLGPALIRQGVPAVVAMRRRLTLKGAQDFTKYFYSDLARSDRVDVATNEARLKLFLNAPETIEWGTPTLFMRLADGILWARAPSPSVPDCQMASRMTKAPCIATGIAREIEALVEDLLSGVEKLASTVQVLTEIELDQWRLRQLRNPAKQLAGFSAQCALAWLQSQESRQQNTIKRLRSQVATSRVEPQILETNEPVSQAIASRLSFNATRLIKQVTTTKSFTSSRALTMGLMQSREATRTNWKLILRKPLRGTRINFYQALVKGCDIESESIQGLTCLVWDWSKYVESVLGQPGNTVNTLPASPSLESQEIL